MTNKNTKFFNATSKTKSVTEKQLREAVRRMVRRVMLKEAEAAAAEEEETPAEEPQAEPKPAPSPEVEAELDAAFQTATDYMIQKLTQSNATPGAEDLTDMVSQILDRFTTSSEERLNILKGIRNNIVH